MWSCARARACEVMLVLSDRFALISVASSHPSTCMKGLFMTGMASAWSTWSDGVIRRGRVWRDTLHSLSFFKIEQNRNSNGKKNKFKRKLNLHYDNNGINEFNNHQNPPVDLENVNFTTTCDPLTGDVIATSKEPTSIYKYNYNLTVMEERYNVLTFSSGNAALSYAR